jgi:lipopolysaccharide/colanic/teichoic acid biosynthesis glycosyltransferase
LIRRLFDLLLVGAAAQIAVPLVAAGAVAVKLSSTGPAFFGGERIGRHGRRFRVWKLRTMVVDAAATGPAITAGGDPRVTRVGRLLRATKLDELPQLWNVALGEMSIVGPRPESPRYVDALDARWRTVLAVRPGITDLASLTFRHEEEVLALARDRDRAYRLVVLPEKLALAVSGIERSSLAFDAWVVARTALAVARVRSERDDDAIARVKRAIAELDDDGKRANVGGEQRP